ncbi:Uncharacterised protein [Neisseria zoodegmatis]|uniref:Uncharacterized protein n=1 Tax=Neisseria zoodegmatis TaxID=326523 RepID=A0A378WH91_9NEIS|nr:hypothetical protein [Neisseria zoodegmatis]SUA35914.1 Uncharacterised protein [Neisseria zoodegmatis]
MTKQINKIDNYSRVASRFIKPLYIKDGLGGFTFSSTCTLVKYSFDKNNEYCEFIIFAYHAVPKYSNTEFAIKNPLHGFYFLDKDDNFISLEEKVKNFVVSEEDDIVICKLSIISKSTNYFNLNLYTIGFSHPIVCNKDVHYYIKDRKEFISQSTLCWIGYPVRNSVDFHRTKASPSQVKKMYHIENDQFGEIRYGLVKYLLIPKMVNYIDDESKKIINFTDDGCKIIGKFNNKDITYYPNGKIASKGYSLKGMSGGALFIQSNFFLKEILELDLNKIQENHEFLYNFLGIGLEFSEKEEKIIGVSANKIIFLLEENKSKFYIP